MTRNVFHLKLSLNPFSKPEARVILLLVEFYFCWLMILLTNEFFLIYNAPTIIHPI
jgi:hypothetical protein